MSWLFYEDWSNERIESIIKKLESEKAPSKETIDFFKDLLVKRGGVSSPMQNGSKYLLSIEGDLETLKESININRNLSNTEFMKYLGENGFRISPNNKDTEQGFAYTRLEQSEYIIQQLKRLPDKKEIHRQELRAELLIAEILIEGFYNRLFINDNEKIYWQARFKRLTQSIK